MFIYRFRALRNAKHLDEPNGRTAYPAVIQSANQKTIVAKVTLVSMIAPSPDWFVGVSGLSLYENGEWVSEKVAELYLYDAGTDSGINFTSADVVTTPPVGIARIDESVLPGSGVPYGTFTFTKK